MKKLYVFCLLQFIGLVALMAQQEKMEVEGAIQIGEASASPDPGTIRFNPTTNDFEGWNGIKWLSLTKGWNGSMGTVLDIEGNIYKTIFIGTQEWMAENLNVGTRIHGYNDQTNNAIIEKYCYNNQESNCDIYGGLYQWDELMQYVTTEGTQGLCPVGWHVPSEEDWTVLTTYLGGISIAGGKMKETGLTHWNSPNVEATNESGFTGLPGGWRHTDGFFYSLNDVGYWWSSSVSGTDAGVRRLIYDNKDVIMFNVYWKLGYSVRCIKD